MPQQIPFESAQNALSARIEAVIAARGCAVAALDGMAASGKTTLGEALARAIPGCHLVHMDDFFLPAEKRTDAYRAATLANADIERFLSEVLTPLCKEGRACYRPFIFHPEARFLPPVTIPAQARAVIVEGAYCLHPSLFPYYDLRVLMTVGPQTQRERILRRNGEAMLLRFSREWIPMENRHIQARDLAHACDILVHTP